MSLYQGTMTVYNLWPLTITGSVTHTSGSNQTTTVNFSNLAVGATTSAATIYSSSGSTDHWSYTMTDSNGDTWSGEKDCGFESKDADKNVNCVFNSNDMDFQVVMPVSSACSGAMGGFLGNMYVSNSLWAPISGTISHVSGSFRQVGITFENLAIGATTQTIPFASDGSDTWYYSITIPAEGGTWTSQGSIGCDFIYTNNLQTVKLYLSGTDAESSLFVGLPVSAGCSTDLNWAPATGDAKKEEA